MNKDNLHNIKKSLVKTNKINLTIQSFMMLGFIGGLGLTFNTPFGFIPGLAFGANIPLFLMELNSRKALKESNSSKMLTYNFFSQSFRYNKNLKKDFTDYIENSHTEIEKKYKTFYLNLWALLKSPHDIHSQKSNFKDYFLFQAISKNIKLYKEVYKNDEIKNTPLEFSDDPNTNSSSYENFFNLQKINDYPFHDKNFLKEMINEYHQMQGDDKKRIDDVINDFQEFGFLGEAFIQLFLESFNLKRKTIAYDYLGPKKIFMNKLKDNDWTKNINFLETILELQNFKFNDTDRKILNQFLTKIFEPEFLENSQRSLRQKTIEYNSLIKIFKENTEEDAHILMKFNQLLHLQVSNKKTYLSSKESQSIFEKELLSKQLNVNYEENKKIEKPFKI